MVTQWILWHIHIKTCFCSKSALCRTNRCYCLRCWIFALFKFKAGKYIFSHRAYSDIKGYVCSIKLRTTSKPISVALYYNKYWKDCVLTTKIKPVLIILLHFLFKKSRMNFIEQTVTDYPFFRLGRFNDEKV